MTPHATDIAQCRRLLRGGSRTFFAASLLLPRNVREPASALYAFCRLADDAVDIDGGDHSAIARLADRLERAYAGRPLPHAADRALAEVVARHAIPQALPQALLEGFAWDASGRRYDDLAALQAYAARVAGAVGAMMALVMGARTPEAIARACDLGIAMQLSNIARDVGEDARAGRIYLPLAWLASAGIDADRWLSAPTFTPALGSVVARVLDAAEASYARAAAGIELLPPGCRPGIRAAHLLYGEIGREVARAGCDSVTRRAVVPVPRKTALLLRALAGGGWTRDGQTMPALDATQFLVDAAAGSAVAEQAAPQLPWWDLDARAHALVRLFERLEHRDRVGRAPLRS
jgi:phytoene synthase